MTTTKNQKNSFSKDVAFLKSVHLIDAFVERYNERNKHNSALNAGHLNEVIDFHLRFSPVFEHPRLVQVNKMGTNSTRRVFIFPESEQLLLKYLNYAIGELDLQLSPHCYSFQRGKRIFDAIKKLKCQDLTNYACIKVDIADYFNSIPIRELTSWLPVSLTKYPYLTGVIEYLLAREEVWIDDTLRPWPQRGVMAGMPLAPTLSNLYLDSFDREMASIYPAYARYSDDMVLFCLEQEADQASKYTASALAQRGLKINEAKSKLYLPGCGFEFLGLKIKGEEVDLSAATITKIKAKIKRQARSLYRWQQRNDVPLEKTLMVMNRKFNRKFFGVGAKATEFTWARYFFSLLTTDKGLKTVDCYYQETMRYLATGRYSRVNYKKVPYGMLKKTGYHPLVSAFYRRHDNPNHFDFE